MADGKRIDELEEQLAQANKTIAVLLEQADRWNERGEATLAMERLDQQIRQKSRALAESEAQLREVNSELRSLHETKAEFISVAAHELRTPLTGIVGYLDLIADGRFGELPEPLSRPITALRRNAYRLKRLVDELLDISDIESGLVTLHPARCVLSAIASEVVEELMPLAVAKNQSVTVVADAQPAIFADEDKVHRAIGGLVANAVRSAPRGGVILVTTDLPPQDLYTGDWARVRVRDNGPGISEALRQRLFEPFAGGRSAKHHTSTGPDPAGLGLYIARGLIEMHRGMITIDSREGAYTELEVLLPLHAGA